MNNKYRVKQSSGKILGPFDQEQMIKLREEGTIKSQDQFQIYPNGDWELLKERFAVAPENTLFIKIDDLTPIEEPFPVIEEKKSEDIEEKINIDTNIEPEVDDTISSEPDKTLINTDTVKYLEELKKQETNALSKNVEDVEKPEVNFKEDKTQVLDLNELKKIKSEANDQEWTPELEPIKTKVKEKTHVFEFNKEDLKKQKKPDFKKLFLIGAIIFFLFAVLFPKEVEKKNEFKLVYPSFDFPVAYEYEEPGKAKKAYQAGLKILQVKNYENLIKSSKHFKKSSEFKIDGNPSLEYLFYNYAQLINESKDQKTDSKVVYKLFKIFESRMVSNPLIATASAYFFKNINKPEAARYFLEKFIKVNNQLKVEGGNSIFTPTNPTRELFAIYLNTLDELQDNEKARQVLVALEGDRQWSSEIYFQVGTYYLKHEEITRAQETINLGLKNYPKDVKLLLLQGKMLIIKQDYEKLAIVLKLVESIEHVFSPSTYSQMFHYIGVLKFSEDKKDSAIKFFKKSLEIKDNPELREQLAAVKNVSEDRELGLLTRESRSREILAQSKQAQLRNDSDQTLTLLLDAIEIAPEFITPKLRLVEYQLDRSLFEEALNRMEDLFKQFPENKEVQFAMAETYIDAYRFNEAQRIISILSTGPYKNDPDYFSLVSTMYLKMNDFLQSASWLRKAMIQNPLNDHDLYRFAKLLLRYNKFKQSKKLIIRALELNPGKLDYHLVYASIIYELEEVETALGYLRSLEENFPNNPKLLSEIAIYLYRDGQIKAYEYTQKKIEKAASGGEELYQFLLRKSLLNEEFNNVVKYGQKIIEIKPHDLETRMLLGKILIEQEKYKEALETLSFVKDRLEAYPKLQFYLSKLYLLTGNRERAKELAEKEVSENPNSEVGFILLGDIYLEEGDYKKSEGYYKKAQDSNADSVDALIGMAFINYKRNQHELALDLYKTAIRKRPNDASLHKKLGDVYRHIGQSKLAIEAYKGHLKLNESSPYKNQIQSYIKLLD